MCFDPLPVPCPWSLCLSPLDPSQPSLSHVGRRMMPAPHCPYIVLTARLYWFSFMIVGYHSHSWVIWFSVSEDWDVFYVFLWNISVPASVGEHSVYSAPSEHECTVIVNFMQGIIHIFILLFFFYCKQYFNFKRFVLRYIKGIFFLFYYSVETSKPFRKFICVCWNVCTTYCLSYVSSTGTPLRTITFVYC